MQFNYQVPIVKIEVKRYKMYYMQDDTKPEINNDI